MYDMVLLATIVMLYVTYPDLIHTLIHPSLPFDSYLYFPGPDLLCYLYIVFIIFLYYEFSLKVASNPETVGRSVDL